MRFFSILLFLFFFAAAYSSFNIDDIDYYNGTFHLPQDMQDYIKEVVDMRNRETVIIPCKPFPTSIPQNVTDYVHNHKMANYEGKCKLLNHDYPPSQCQEWDISVMVALTKAHSTRILDNVRSFMMAISTDCTSKSKIKYYAPGLLDNYTESSDSNCLGKPAGSQEFYDYFGSLHVNDTWTRNNGDINIFRMFNQFFLCEKGRDPSRAGVLFYFTNLECAQDCVETSRDFLELVANQVWVVDGLNKIGYIMKMIYISTPVNNFYKECNVKNILAYSNEHEEVIVVNDSISSLMGYATAFRPCTRALIVPGGDFLFSSIMMAVCLVLAIIVSVFIVNKLYGRIKRRKPGLEAFVLMQHEKMNEIAKLPLRIKNYTDRYERLKNAANRNKQGRLEIDRSFLFLEDKEIFAGRFGKVCKGICRYPLGDGYGDVQFEVAVKKLNAAAPNIEKMRLFGEISVLLRLQHAHVVDLLGKVSSEHDPVIVFKYCHNRDLLTLLRQHRDEEHECNLYETGHCFDWNDLLQIAYEIADGMNYVGESRIIHRNLKARNILMTNDMIPKITGFGFSCPDDGLKRKVPTRLRDLPQWSAPEALEHGTFSTSSDVWSFGVLMYELMTMGAQPYEGLPKEEMLTALKSGRRLSLKEIGASEEMEVLLHDCFLEPLQRTNFAEIMQFIDEIFEEDDTEIDPLTQEPDEVSIDSAIHSQSSISLLADS